VKRACNEDTATVVVLFNVKKQQPELRSTINCELGICFTYFTGLQAGNEMGKWEGVFSVKKWKMGGVFCKKSKKNKGCFCTKVDFSSTQVHYVYSISIF